MVDRPKVGSAIVMVGCALAILGLFLAWEHGGWDAHGNFYGQTRNITTPLGPPSAVVVIVIGCLLAGGIWLAISGGRSKAAAVAVLGLGSVALVASTAKLLAAWSDLLPHARLGSGGFLALGGCLLALTGGAVARSASPDTSGVAPESGGQGFGQSQGQGGPTL